jgi:O-antigen biosynthesis protein
VTVRPRISGKFLYRGNDKLYLKGVTYGTFAKNAEGFQFPVRRQVEADFSLMGEHGFNAVRVYTPPPAWLLDAAAKNGLHVMVGLSWDQYVAFLEQRGRTAAIQARIREQVRQYAGHPAVLCYTLANEIPAPIVRWYGRRRIEDFLRGLYDAAKEVDPTGLVTYVNFPTTEYLVLPFLDFFCFNVYLEQRQRLEAYLGRLQNLAGERPLLLAEVGLDSRRNGEQKQADTLSWQIEASFASGCAGLFVFAWTDEWNVAGYDVEDWDFGLVRRDRSPKRALAAVTSGLCAAPFSNDLSWPRVSVIVCTFNGRKTLRDTLQALQRLDYPDFEIIVVSDGSNDGCVALAYGYGVNVITGPNRGLSEARNVGFRAASGQIVAYVDDDAYPDPQWLRYLAYGFMSTSYAAIGGPNLAPAGSGWVADCVANSPGGAQHVLLSDLEAEHIPGCNMSYRRWVLEQLGGFDGQFRIAGDDVDLCWRVLERGWTIGFSPAALVWHHRRNSIRGYFKQQENYGKAEAMLERKWPRKFNTAGHACWSGRVYGKGHTAGVQKWRSRIYHGIWGSAPFQSLYEPPATLWEHLPLMPEWYLVNAALAALVVCGLLWHPLFAAAPVLLLAAGLPLVQAIRSALDGHSPTQPLSMVERLRFRIVTAFLHMLQPMARLFGRLSFGLSPWRMRLTGRLSWPTEKRVALWSETWRPHEERLQGLFDSLIAGNALVDIGGAFDRWDLHIRGGLLGAVRTLIAVEDHAPGRQLIRCQFRPRASLTVSVVAAVFGVLGLIAALDGATLAAIVLTSLTAVLIGRIVFEQASAMSAALTATAAFVERHTLVRLPSQPRAPEEQRVSG